jgi:hypothetical protein
MIFHGLRAAASASKASATRVERETTAPDDIQASAAARTALAPLLHPWKGSSAALTAIREGLI